MVRVRCRALILGGLGLVCAFSSEYLQSLDLPGGGARLVTVGWTDTEERCHNWGGAPTYFLSDYVLGVRVDDPVSDRRIVIEPRLGDLREVEGTVVTEFGPVAVRWGKTDDGKKLTFEVQIPVDVKAKARIPRFCERPTLVFDVQTVDTATAHKVWGYTKVVDFLGERQQLDPR